MSECLRVEWRVGSPSDQSGQNSASTWGETAYSKEGSYYQWIQIVSIFIGITPSKQGVHDPPPTIMFCKNILLSGRFTRKIEEGYWWCVVVGLWGGGGLKKSEVPTKGLSTQTYQKGGRNGSHNEVLALSEHHWFNFYKGGWIGGLWGSEYLWLGVKEWAGEVAFHSP